MRAPKNLYFFHTYQFNFALKIIKLFGFSIHTYWSVRAMRTLLGSCITISRVWYCHALELVGFWNFQLLLVLGYLDFRGVAYLKTTTGNYHPWRFAGGFSGNSLWGIFCLGIYLICLFLMLAITGSELNAESQQN